MLNILHITPTVPPVTNGVGDFSKILVDNLKEKGYNKNSFLVYKSGSIEKLKEPIVQLNKQNLYHQISFLVPDLIILHYVGYAYDRKGLPLYLISALKRYFKKTDVKILVFFHELYSSSNNPFKLPFYTNYLQKRIVKKLVDLSFATFTNCELYHSLLRELVEPARFNNICSGIYSNIPDILYSGYKEKEKNSMVVFGSYIRRISIYKNREFTKLLDRMAIRKVYDVGPGQVEFYNSKIEFQIKGNLDEVEVAEVLNKAQFGAIDYPPQVLGKSGIFSAYAAFGVIPINFCGQKEPLYDNLVEGENYFTSTMSFEGRNIRLIEEKINSWYRKRNAKEITNLITKFFDA